MISNFDTYPGNAFFHITLPVIFKTTHTASYNAEVLDCIDGLYPGLRKMLIEVVYLFRNKNAMPVRKAIHQRGEQTINRAAKTSVAFPSYSKIGKCNIMDTK